LLPRVAALMDIQPVSDIIGIEDESTFVRTIYAGNAIQTIKSLDSVKMFTVRGTAFEAAKLDSSASPAEVTKADGEASANDSSSFINQELAKSDRPALSAAKVIVRYVSLSAFQKSYLN